ncbi:N-acetylmuramoyl-L-alanine amidase [Chitinophaga japonensis]|uniref:N-acetylmuramoyl-L-alanine amidase n=1 Tax=Chitinophaga japonensis TaxID=104662 RepID=A0A562SZ31_CHIJA|nr:N-acetylmuramoyl-L-alanine amidase [Chitinophaga japonensis]TWI86284.1 N-acetylmuramoyl-L-alanine amidase [Chitinophaga japonensis]
MRTIKYIVIHCTATQPNATVEAIQRYWRTPKPNGMNWKNPGYHYIIRANGDIEVLADESQATNGVAGHNQNSIHVSYIGGVDKQGYPLDTRTPEQRVVMKAMVKILKARYPGAIVQGHRDFLTPGTAGWKDCPSFDVRTWLKQEGI